MKDLLKSLTILSLALLHFGLVHAQKSESITVVYEIDLDMEGMDEQTKAMMANSTMEVAHDGDYTRVTNEVSMSKTIITTNNKTEESLMVIEAMGNTMAIPLDIAQLNQQNDRMDDDMEVVVTDETIEVLDFTCKKIILQSGEGDQQVVMYVAEELNPAGKSFKYSHPDINGMPLKIESTDGSISSTMTAISVKRSASGTFSTKVPKGVQVLDYDVYSQMQKFMDR